MPTNAQAHGPALRATYLLAFDNFATDPTEVAALPEVGNVRYAREILGLLQEHNLVVETDVNGEGMVWQTADTYDNATREQAEATIDGYLASYDAEFQVAPEKAPARRSKPSKTNPAGLPLCLCGCGVAGKSDYRPGHDARHAGNLARAILSGEMAVNVATKGLSDALRAKVLGQVERGNSKVTAGKGKATPKAPKAKRLQGSPAWVKVGRWIKQGEVGATTVGPDGKENANSEVVAINYVGKGGEVQTVAIDNAKFVKGVNWDLGSPVA